jgi:hypothetical protein
VIGESRRVGTATQALEQGGRALDVGEEKGQCLREDSVRDCSDCRRPTRN